jgi:hypothetical protein
LFPGLPFRVSPCCCISSPTIPFILVGIARPRGADVSKRNSGEVFGRSLEPMLLVCSSQRHKRPQDSISHAKTDDERLLGRTAPIWASALLLQSSMSWVVWLGSPNGPH